MRTILLTRGVPGCGKSTWIKKFNLEQYSLSADSIRLLMQSPITDLNGKLVISQKNDGEVWKMLFTILEQRMERGEFIVVDATHYKAELLQKYYKLVDKYRYRAFVVDFTDVPLDVCLERNRSRSSYKFVPEDAIRKMHAVFESEKDSKACKEVSNKFTIIKPEHVLQMFDNNYLLTDVTDKYSKVVVFGDIHGCYKPLQDYFEQNPFDNNTQYIFTGDYIDRGIQNKEVLSFISSIKDNKNVILLEGNHEIHLRKFASKEKGMIDTIRSNEFKRNTIPQILDMNKGDLRQICRKLHQLVYFKFGGMKYLVTHGGVPCIPNILTPTEELIKGVGKYEDETLIGENFEKNTNCECVQIHAHRNIFHKPMRYSDYHYNLCDEPEFGGNVRIIEINADGEIKEILQPSTIFKSKEGYKDMKVEYLNKDNPIEQMNKSKLIQKKDLGDGIVSYNFTRKCFYDKIWNGITCKARGLFVDTLNDNKVIARGYSKFFNIGEVEETELYSLNENLSYPCEAYLKENGFIGFVSYNPKDNSLFVASKSTNTGDFADMVREQLDLLGEDSKEYIKNYCKENDCTLIFECINKDKDPHIIKYLTNHLVLLDIVKNKIEDEFADYQEVLDVAKKINVKNKQKHYIFNNWDEFYSWYKMMQEDNHTPLEGYVVKDSKGFRIKYKTNFYRFWKYMRGIKDKLSKDQNVRPDFKNEDEIRVFNYMRKMDKDILAQKSIIDIREEYIGGNNDKE